MAGYWEAAYKFAKQAGLSRRTVARWCANGNLLAKRVGGLWLVWVDVPEVGDEEREFQKSLVKGGE